MAAALLEKASIGNLGLVLRGLPSRDELSSGSQWASRGVNLLSVRNRSNVRIGHARVRTIGLARWRACALNPGQGHTSVEQEQQHGTIAYFNERSGFFDVQGSHIFKPPQSNKGWDDQLLLAQIRYVAVVADDRSEMHRSASIQRDNWGKLIQVTTIMSMISAALLAALNTQVSQSFSLSLTSALLAAGSVFFMGLANWFQPSQQAEEQRAAARFFKNLVKEIEMSLKPGGSQLKEDANLFYEAKLQRLQYLDRAFPLTLFRGINKFPEEVGPSVLSPPVDTSKAEVQPEPGLSDNGWSPAIVADLKRTSELLRRSEIATYVGWGKNALKINKVLAIAGPSFAVASIVANFVGGWSAVAAGCCALAALTSSFSHDAQVGMVYEMYRDVAGTFDDMDKEIQRSLRLPVEQREDGELFHQKIALQLGRMEGEAIVSSNDQKTAGTLL